MVKKTSAAQAKAQFSALMAEVAHGGKRVVIERRGKPLAALVSVSDLELLEEVVQIDGLISQFEVTNQVLEAEGQRIAFKIYEDIDIDDYPDGTLVMYWEEEFYNGVEGSLSGPTGRKHMKFIGWIDTEPTTIEADEFDTRRSVTLQCVDVGGRLKRLPGFSTVMERDAAPSGWHQMAALDLNRYIWFLLNWHSTALDLAEFRWTLSGHSYYFSVLTCGAGNLFSMCDGRAQAMAHRLTCDKFGRLALKQDPQLLEKYALEASSTYADTNRDTWVMLEAPTGAGGTTTITASGRWWPSSRRSSRSSRARRPRSPTSTSRTCTTAATTG